MHRWRRLFLLHNNSYRATHGVETDHPRGCFPTPQRVSFRVDYMTPAWRAAARFAADTASGLGLEMSVASFPGWSGTGGPWVLPEEGMKKLVWG